MPALANRLTAAKSPTTYWCPQPLEYVRRLESGTAVDLPPGWSTSTLLSAPWG